MQLNLISPLNQLGYGIVGLNILKSLVGRGHVVSYFPIGQNIEVENRPDVVKIVQDSVKNAQYYGYNSPTIRIWHQHEMTLFAGKGPRIGWPIFELDSFTDQEKHHLKATDRLFVCSQWAKDVVRQNIGDHPCDVVPLGVDGSVFYMDENARVARPYWLKDTTVFINVGKWEIRKGHKELLEAFCSAFTTSDNVELWMINTNPFIGMENEQWKAKYISSPMGSKIKLLPRITSQEGLRAIFNQADFGVFPSHAEGWNLEPLELMACGTPCIATDYSGHTEYLNEDNSILIEPNGREPAHDGRWFHGQGNWCTFKIEQLVESLRHAHSNTKKFERKLRYDDVLKNTVEKFSWNNSAKRIEELLTPNV